MEREREREEEKLEKDNASLGFTKTRKLPLPKCLSGNSRKRRSPPHRGPHTAFSARSHCAAPGGPTDPCRPSGGDKSGARLLWAAAETPAAPPLAAGSHTPRKNQRGECIAIEFTGVPVAYTVAKVTHTHTHTRTRTRTRTACPKTVEPIATVLPARGVCAGARGGARAG